MSDLNPTISVIIPVYNVEKYLTECVESVLRQTCKDYEVILVDDGSSDSSGELCDRIQGENDRVSVIHQANAGLSAARNSGYEASKGEYIYFLDSDDRIVPETLERLTRVIRDADADFVFFDGKSFEDPGNYQIRQGYRRARAYPPCSGMDMFDALQGYGEFKPSVPLCLWKKAFLEKNHLRFFPGILYEDMIFTFEAFCRADRVAHCHEQLYHRRLREASIVTAQYTERHFISACVVLDEVIRIARESDLLDRKSVNDYIARCAMRPLDIYSSLSLELRKRDRGRYEQTVDTIRSNAGFGSRALYYRTYGRLPWAACRVYEKLITERK